MTWLAGGFGGNAARSLPSPSGDAVAPSAPPPNAPASTGTPVAIGHGPTDIDFLDGNHGWIATGCDSYCYESNPHIIRTTNGGRTWSNVPPPNMAGAAILGEPVWLQYGGVVKVRFTSATRGWYLQAGRAVEYERWGREMVAGSPWAESSPPWPRQETGCGHWWIPAVDFPVPHSTCSTDRTLIPRGSARPRRLSSGSGQESGSRLDAFDHTAYIALPGHTYSATLDGTAPQC